MFVGREKELESLSLLLDKRTASLVACRGRRRIGKSTLIEALRILYNEQSRMLAMKKSTVEYESALAQNNENYKIK